MDSLQKALVQAVRDFAQANYEMDGWDYIVECYEDDDILRVIEDAKTSQQAIRNAGLVCKAQDSYRKDIQATAF